MAILPSVVVGALTLTPIALHDVPEPWRIFGKRGNQERGANVDVSELLAIEPGELE
jgi:hypothetical protein